MSDKKLFDKAWEVSGEKLYDFELMSGGGHIKGYSVVGDALERLAESIEEYEAAHENGVMYAVGDRKPFSRGGKIPLGKAQSKRCACNSSRQIRALRIDSARR